MKVFLTGASGFVGSAVAQELLKNGHRVLGLARSAESAQALKEAGLDVHRGDLNDLASLRAGVEASDGVIHCGFIHDFTRFNEVCAIDRKAILAMGEVLQTRPMVVTSGIGILKPGVVDETNRVVSPPINPRATTEMTVNELVERGANVSLMRLPPTTHGKGDHGFIPMLIAIARQKGHAAYIGDGMNHWPAVHRFDAAKVYRLALERQVAGSNYHPIAEDGLPFREIAGAIGRGLGCPVESVSDAATYFGGFAHFAGMDFVAKSAWTREILGWKPTFPTLFEDLVSAKYFEKPN